MTLAQDGAATADQTVLHPQKTAQTLDQRVSSDLQIQVRDKATTLAQDGAATADQTVLHPQKTDQTLDQCVSSGFQIQVRDKAMTLSQDGAATADQMVLHPRETGQTLDQRVSNCLQMRMRVNTRRKCMIIQVSAQSLQCAVAYDNPKATRFIKSLIKRLSKDSSCIDELVPRIEVGDGKVAIYGFIADVFIQQPGNEQLNAKNFSVDKLRFFLAPMVCSPFTYQMTGGITEVQNTGGGGSQFYQMIGSGFHGLYRVVFGNSYESVKVAAPFFVTRADLSHLRMTKHVSVHRRTSKTSLKRQNRTPISYSYSFPARKG
jgi:hypothetical protein